MNKNKIRVLFKLRSIEMGGAQKVLINILNNLDRNKFKITLFLDLYQGKLLKEIPKDIDIKYIGIGKEFMSKNNFIRKIQLIVRFIKLRIYKKFPLLLYYNKQIRNQDIEIAFFHYNYKDILNSPNKKSKKIGWMHGDIKDITIIGNKEKFVSTFLQFDAMIYVSNQTLKSAQTFNSEIFNNAKVIYNPINVKEILFKSEEKINDILSSYKKDKIPSFLSIGRVDSGKGYHILLEVHKRLIKEDIYHKIYIIGEGYSKKELIRKVIEYQLEKTFIFLGEKTNPYPYIKQADFFILPSFSEAYPLVIAESLILEKPIITTDVGGIREMMTEDNGIFVKSKDEGELYTAIKRILKENNLINKFIENNKKYKEYFEPKKVYEQIEFFLSEILKNNANKR